MVGTTQGVIKRPIGAALLAHRKALVPEVSVREAARRLSQDGGGKFDHTHLSRIETGHSKPTDETVARIGRVYGLSEQDIGVLLAMSHGEEPNGRWYATRHADWRLQLQALTWFEQRAQSIVQLSNLLIPGRFQTMEFAEAIMTAAGLEEWEVEERAQIRTARAAIHARRRNPVPITAFIAEEALHRAPVNDPALMADQLLELWEWTDPKRPHVDIRIIPRTAGWYSGIETGYVLIERGGALPDIVNIELHSTGLLLQDEADVRPIREGVDTLRAVALSREKSRDYIATIAHKFESGSESVA